MAIQLRTRSKYGNRKTTVDGITFASAKEARRYQELRLLEHANEIRAFVVQPRFPLCVQRNGALTLMDAVEIGAYVADFSYVRVKDGVRCVEDVKGVKTALYKWKKKHVEAQYGVTIQEV